MRGGGSHPDGTRLAISMAPCARFLCCVCEGQQGPLSKPKVGRRVADEGDYEDERQEVLVFVDAACGSRVIVLDPEPEDSSAVEAAYVSTSQADEDEEDHGRPYASAMASPSGGGGGGAATSSGDRASRANPALDAAGGVGGGLADGWGTSFEEMQSDFAELDRFTGFHEVGSLDSLDGMRGGANFGESGFELIDLIPTLPHRTPSTRSDSMLAVWREDDGPPLEPRGDDLAIDPPQEDGWGAAASPEAERTGLPLAPAAEAAEGAAETAEGDTSHRAGKLPAGSVGSQPTHEMAPGSSEPALVDPVDLAI